MTETVVILAEKSSPVSRLPTDFKIESKNSVLYLHFSLKSRVRECCASEKNEPEVVYFQNCHNFDVESFLDKNFLISFKWVPYFYQLKRI